VQAGEPLCDGSVDPHDILHIPRQNALQTFLLNEVQEVYRPYGVNINDKQHRGHRPPETEGRDLRGRGHVLHFREQVDKFRFNEENEKVIREGGQPAIARPLLLGITRASLNIDSFISAASFQETTKVLTNAAIAGSVDNLRGLKENVIIGHLIPAGTGIKAYRNVKLFDENNEDLDVMIKGLIEARKAEKKPEFEEEALSIPNSSKGRALTFLAGW
jgi:DNA-directed RNA polymerase subunit beta'